MSIRVIIADDHAIVRLGIRRLIDVQAGGEIQVADEVEDGGQLLEAVQAHRPDVLLLDVMMPGPDVVSQVSQVRELPDPPRVIILTGYAQDATVLPLLAAGVSGYLLKDDIPETIVQAIRAVASGQTWFSQQIAGLIVRSTYAPQESEQLVGASPLTPREWEILQQIGQGKSNSEIADQLTLSKTTVQNYVSSIYGKLGIETRAQAILYAMRNKLVDINDVPEG
jgi:DNA-binding NarL/FixJ family response regulator